jgi:nitrile hydratase accessory protein
LNTRKEPLFRAPWEAQAFALVEHLKTQGLITPREWADALGAAIRVAQAKGDPDTGETYYHHWLAALETVLHEKNLASFVAVEARDASLSQAPPEQGGSARRVSALRRTRESAPPPAFRLPRRTAARRVRRPMRSAPPPA